MLMTIFYIMYTTNKQYIALVIKKKYMILDKPVSVLLA